jgi:hypothetical protein
MEQVILLVAEILAVICCIISAVYFEREEKNRNAAIMAVIAGIFALSCLVQSLGGLKS